MRCITKSECSDISGEDVAIKVLGAGIDASWMDCPKGDNTANPKVCCGIKSGN